MNTYTVDVHYQQAVITVRTGGGTFARDAARNATLPGRYIVAVGKPHARVVKGTNASLIAKALRELSDDRSAWRVSDELASCGLNDRALGTWVDGDTVYIDVVESFFNLNNALRVARERGEIAIWDSVDNVEIRTDAV